MQSGAEIAGFASGTRGFFRKRTPTREGVGDWSEVVSLLVG